MNGLSANGTGSEQVKRSQSAKKEYLMKPLSPAFGLFTSYPLFQAVIVRAAYVLGSVTAVSSEMREDIVKVRNGGVDSLLVSRAAIPFSLSF